MSRREFIERYGATCRNWTWSWSFVNHEERFVIFGAWDINQSSKGLLILDGEWELSEKGRRQPGYGQAREHIELVEHTGYRLFVFPMEFERLEDGSGTGPARIKGFRPELIEKSLARIGNKWYAVNGQPYPSRSDTGSEVDHSYWARIALQHLVAHVLQYRGGKILVTYGELAAGIGYPEPHTGNRFGREIGRTLSRMGHLIHDINIDDERPPMIQTLVVSASNRLPSDGLKEFDATYPSLPAHKKKDFVGREIQRITAFGNRWQRVLDQLDLADPRKQPSEPHDRGGGWSNRYGSEGSPEHRRLRDYIAKNPGIVGAPEASTAVVEYPLRSGDTADVVFTDGNIIVCVEVKSERSSEQDVLRGLFQCVKYEAVLCAEGRVEREKRSLACFLVLARPFPRGLRAIRNALGIRVVENLDAGE